MESDMLASNPLHGTDSSPEKSPTQTSKIKQFGSHHATGWSHSR